MIPKHALRHIVAESLTFACIALLAAPAHASCLGNFEATGSIFKGRVYSTYADFANVPVKLAMERLRHQLPAKEIDVLSADDDQGVASGRTRPKPNQRPIDIDFNISATATGGTRVKMVMTLPAGAFGSPNLKGWMCGVVDLAASETPVAAAGDAPPPTAAPEAAAPSAPAVAAEPPPYEPQEPPLTNDDILKLTQAGVARELIVTKIQQAPSVAFDLSTDGLIALSRGNVAKEVIAAMQQRSANSRQ
jgi:hypothetical protein